MASLRKELEETEKWKSFVSWFLFIGNAYWPWNSDQPLIHCMCDKLYILYNFIINRPGLAGAVLQSPRPLID